MTHQELKEDTKWIIQNQSYSNFYQVKVKIFDKRNRPINVKYLTMLFINEKQNYVIARDENGKRHFIPTKEFRKVVENNDKI